MLRLFQERLLISCSASWRTYQLKASMMGLTCRYCGKALYSEKAVMRARQVKRD